MIRISLSLGKLWMEKRRIDRFLLPFTIFHNIFSRNAFFSSSPLTCDCRKLKNCEIPFLVSFVFPHFYKSKNQLQITSSILFASHFSGQVQHRSLSYPQLFRFHRKDLGLKGPASLRCKLLANGLLSRANRARIVANRTHACSDGTNDLRRFASVSLLSFAFMALHLIITRSFSVTGRQARFVFAV